MELRESCLRCYQVSALMLQKLAGRCVSFMLAVPAAKLYTREIHMGISAALRSGGYIKISGNLRDEILLWRFLDRWQGKFQWKEENHIVVAMSLDASLFKWGGHVSHPRIGDTEVSDFWPDSMKNLPIMVL